MPTPVQDRCLRLAFECEKLREERAQLADMLDTMIGASKYLLGDLFDTDAVHVLSVTVERIEKKFRALQAPETPGKS